MIRVVKGNLLDATEIVIAHQVNCQKKMNSGVAKAIREKYPEAFEKYLETDPQLGNVGFVFVPTDKLTGNGITIANMYAQDMRIFYLYISPNIYIAIQYTYNTF